MIYKVSTLLIGLMVISGISYSQVPNNICADAIMLTVDGSCGTFSTLSSTNSANPFDGLTCGTLNQGDSDVWFMTVVPKFR